MPSVEILAVGHSRPVAFDELPFAVEPDQTRSSHRSPSRFQHDFDQLSGVLYHLGNPSLKADRQGRCFFAYQLLSRESQQEATFLEFRPEYLPHLRSLLVELLEESPAHRLVFTSDWQFGPEWTKYESEQSLDQFWKLHDSRHLLLNALYPVCGVSNAGQMQQE